MSQDLAVSPATGDGNDEVPPARRTTPAGPRRPGKPLWRHPTLWLGVLTVLIVFNALYALPRYLTLDPAMSRVFLAADVPAHFSFVVLHVVTGNIAMIALFFQFWPWLRRHHRRVHRISGRVYIFAGALPSAALGLVIVPMRPDPAGSLGLVMMAVLWIGTTLMALHRARQRRFAEHRRWMVYSLALALATTWGRIVFVLYTTIPGFYINTTVLIELANWASWIVNLLVAHLCLEWLARRRRAARRVESFASVS